MKLKEFLEQKGKIRGEETEKRNKNNESKVACTTYLQHAQHKANGGSFSVIFTSSYKEYCYFTSLAVLVSLSSSYT